MATMGATFNQHPEFSASIGRQINKHTPSFVERVGIGRIILAVSEVVVGIAAEAFSGGTSSVLVGTGIATAFGIGNEIYDVAKGETSTVGTALNFGSALIPGLGRLGSAGVTALRGTEAITRGIANEAIKSFGEVGLTGVTKSGIQQIIKSGVLGQVTKGNIFRTTLKFGSREAKKAIRFSAAQALEKSARASFEAAGKTLTANLLSAGNFLGKKGLTALESGSRGGLAQGAASVQDFFRKSLSEAGLTSERIVQILERIGKVSTEDEFRVELEIILKNELTVAEREAFAKAVAVKAGKFSVEDLATTTQRKMFDNFKEDWAQLNKLTKEARTATGFKQKWKSYNRLLGSAEFNDQIVQRVQLSDPHDLFRVPSEIIYKKIGRKLEEFFGKWAKRLGRIGKLDKAWSKLEGAVLLDSEWILGYRILQDEGIYKFVQITFKSDVTNNKPPVYTWMSTVALKRFRESPGRYYMRHIKKKAFGFFKGNPIAERILSFIPAQTLKNVLSLSSNVTSTIGALANGTFTKGYLNTGIKTLINNSENRLGRLVGRKLAGGLATVFFGRTVGRLVGRLGQKAATQVAIPAITGKRMDLPTAIGKTFLSESRRRLKRRNRNSAVLQKVSARRKLGYLARVPGSVVPGSWTLARTKLGF